MSRGFFSFLKINKHVTSQTTLIIVDWSYKPTRVFSTCFVITHTLTGKLPGRSLIQRLLQVKYAYQVKHA